MLASRTLKMHNNSSFLSDRDLRLLWERRNEVRANAVENLSTAMRGLSAAGAQWLICSLFFFFFFYTILTSVERGASAV